MTATHTLSEAQITELARAMRDALTAVSEAGYARSTHVHDHHTSGEILRSRRDAAQAKAAEVQKAMWTLFYEVMSRDVDNLAALVDVAEPSALFGPDRAALAVVNEGGYGVGYADRGVAGYTPTTYTPKTYEEAKAIARSINETMGLTPEEVSGIVLSSLSPTRR